MALSLPRNFQFDEETYLRYKMILNEEDFTYALTERVHCCGYVEIIPEDELEPDAIFIEYQGKLYARVIAYSNGMNLAIFSLSDVYLNVRDWKDVYTIKNGGKIILYPKDLPTESFKVIP